MDQQCGLIVGYLVFGLVPEMHLSQHHVIVFFNLNRSPHVGVVKYQNNIFIVIPERIPYF